METFERYKLTNKRIAEIEAMPVKERTALCGRYGEGRCHIPCSDKYVCGGYGIHNSMSAKEVNIKTMRTEDALLMTDDEFAEEMRKDVITLKIDKKAILNGGFFEIGYRNGK